VGLYHAEGDDPSAFLLGDRRKKTLEEGRDPRINERRPIPRGPDDMNEEPISHSESLQ
jgi:hypothetical protein